MVGVITGIITGIVALIIVIAVIIVAVICYRQKTGTLIVLDVSYFVPMGILSGLHTTMDVLLE